MAIRVGFVFLIGLSVRNPEDEVAVHESGGLAFSRHWLCCNEHTSCAVIVLKLLVSSCHHFIEAHTHTTDQISRVHSGTLWGTLDCLWNTLTHSGTLWFYLECGVFSGVTLEIVPTLWSVLGQLEGRYFLMA